MACTKGDQQRGVDLRAFLYKRETDMLQITMK